jgi:glutamyl-tRNA reductase
LSPSLAAEAVALAEREMGTVSGVRALVVGGGEIARLLVENLAAKRPSEILVANRTPAAVESLAGRVGARVLSLTDLPTALPEVDLLVSATSARTYLLTPSDFPEGRQKPLCLIDLAIPRDVDPAVGNLPGIRLFDLEALVPAGRPPEWEDDIARMEAIIAAEMRDFVAWDMTRRVAPVIANLRSHVEAVQRQELERVAPQLSGLTEREWEAVERLTGRLVDKMFHHLVVRLRLAAQTDRKLVEAAEFFFLHGEGGLFSHALEEATGKRESDEVHR